jgi:hypothetical protein
MLYAAGGKGSGGGGAGGLGVRGGFGFSVIVFSVSPRFQVSSGKNNPYGIRCVGQQLSRDLGIFDTSSFASMNKVQQNGCWTLM